MKKFLLGLPTGVVSTIAVLVIVFLSLAPTDIMPGEWRFAQNLDKWAHGIMYFCCTLCFMFDLFKHQLPHHTKLNSEMAFTACAILLGLIMEVMQLFLTEGRGYEIADWVADIIGAVLAFLLWRLVLRKFLRKYLYHSLRRPKHHHHHHHHHSSSSSSSSSSASAEAKKAAEEPKVEEKVEAKPVEKKVEKRAETPKEQPQPKPEPKSEPEPEPEPQPQPQRRSSSSYTYYSSSSTDE